MELNGVASDASHYREDKMNEYGNRNDNQSPERVTESGRACESVHAGKTGLFIGHGHVPVAEVRHQKCWGKTFNLRPQTVLLEHSLTIMTISIGTLRRK